MSLWSNFWSGQNNKQPKQKQAKKPAVTTVNQQPAVASAVKTAVKVEPKNPEPSWLNDKKTKNYNAMVVVKKTKTRIFREIALEDIPSDSFEKEYKGEMIHILRLDIDNNLHSMYRPAPAKDRSPTDFYIANNCADEVSEVYGMDMPVTEKIKWGIFIGLCVVDFIFVFLIIFSHSGGVPQ